MNDEILINLKSLIALCIRRGRTVLAGTLLGAILMGGLGYILLQREDPAQIIKENDLKADCIAQLETTENQIAAQREYLENSLYMKLDASHVYNAVISLDIVVDDPSALEQPYGQDVTPMDYLVSKVINRYVTVWAYTELSQVLEGVAGADRYLREIVKIEGNASAGQIRIIALSNSPEEAEALAENACAFLHSQTATAAEATYQHVLRQVSSGIWEVGSKEILDTQSKAYDTLEEYRETRDELEKTLQGLTPGHPVIKNAMIGAAAAFFLFCFYIVFKSILMSTMDDPFALEDLYQLPLLGSLYKPANALDSLSCRILRLNTNASVQDTREYIANKASLLLPNDSSVLLTSSQPVLDEERENFIHIFDETGKNIVFAADFGHNPQAMEALGNCQTVILVEFLGKSSIQDIQKLMVTVSNVGKSVKGYILY